MRVALEPSPDGTAFAAFRANSAATCEIGLLAGQDAAEFWFRTTLYQAPNALAFRASSSGHTARRGAEHIAQGREEIGVFVLVEGHCDTTCHGQRILEGPGDVAIRDYTQPFTTIQAAYDAMVLMLPRDRLPAVLLTPELHGTHIPAAEGGARLIAGALAALLDAADDLSIPGFEAGVEGICAMLVGAMHGRTALAGSEAMRARALALIERHLDEPDLCAARIEARLGLSRSSLYRLFAPLGGVQAIILRRRLDRSAKALLAAPPAKAALERIAVQTGFRGEAHLARAFRRHFGLSPRAFQDMATRTDHAGLIAQAERAGFVTLAAWLNDTDLTLAQQTDQR